MDGENDGVNTQAHLFTLRVWVVDGADNVPQWRGRLQDIQSGEVTYFKDWLTLIAYIEDSMRGQAA